MQSLPKDDPLPDQDASQYDRGDERCNYLHRRIYALLVRMNDTKVWERSVAQGKNLTLWKLLTRQLKVGEVDAPVSRVPAKGMGKGPYIRVLFWSSNSKSRRDKRAPRIWR